MDQYSDQAEGGQVMTVVHHIDGRDAIMCFHCLIEGNGLCPTDNCAEHETAY